MNSVHIFGIPIDGSSLASASDRVVRGPWPCWIVTANAEILLAAKRDSEFADALLSASIRMIDGSGPEFLLRIFGQRVERVAGVDLALALIELANNKKWRVAFIGGRAGVAVEAMNNIRSRFSDLQIFAEEGGCVSLEGNEDVHTEEMRHRLTLFDPHVVLVAFGHPKQEQWVKQHILDFPSLKVIVGVGGTFDYWANRVKRAPLLWQRFGVEWFWRFLHQPFRWRRIWNAIVLFPLYFIIDRLKKRGR